MKKVELLQINFTYGKNNADIYVAKEFQNHDITLSVP